MSAFYWVLYIFLAIMALLCLTAFVMYMCRLCNKSKDFDEEAFFTARERGLDLNSTETTQLMTGDNNTTQTDGAGQSGIQLVHVKRTNAENRENNGVVATNNTTPPPRPVATTRATVVVPPSTATREAPGVTASKKPAITPRPLSIGKPPIANRPSSVASGVSKPSNLPPAPPQKVETAIVNPQPHQHKQASAGVHKPKSAPPPPPSQDSIYENTSKKRHAPPPPPNSTNQNTAFSRHDSLPTYDDVMVDIPVDNYLTDNE